jgi:hypothetical protein
MEPLQTVDYPYNFVDIWPLISPFSLPCCFVRGGLALAGDAGHLLSDPWLRLARHKNIGRLGDA